MTAHCGLDANLVALSGDERDLDERRVGELCHHPVARLRGFAACVMAMRLALPQGRRIPRQDIAPDSRLRLQLSEHHRRVHT